MEWGLPQNIISFRHKELTYTLNKYYRHVTE